MKEIDKVGLIYSKNGKILGTKVEGKDVYYIPGGKRKEKEDDKQALIRECREELSVQLKEETIQYFGTFTSQAYGKEDGTIVRMVCYTAEFEGEAKPDSEVEKLDWIGYQDFDKVSYLDKPIYQQLFDKGMIQ